MITPLTEMHIIAAKASRECDLHAGSSCMQIARLGEKTVGAGAVQEAVKKTHKVGNYHAINGIK